MHDSRQGNQKQIQPDSPTERSDCMDLFLMLAPDEQEFLDYVTEKYGDRDCPAKKQWTLQEHFNFLQEDLEEMLFDLFTRYGIDHSNFNLDNYFMPEFYWWQLRLKKEWRNRKFKSLTLEMIIESAKAGRWLYD